MGSCRSGCSRGCGHAGMAEASFLLTLPLTLQLLFGFAFPRLFCKIKKKIKKRNKTTVLCGNLAAYPSSPGLERCWRKRCLNNCSISWEHVNDSNDNIIIRNGFDFLGTAQKEICCFIWKEPRCSAFTCDMSLVCFFYEFKML